MSAQLLLLIESLGRDKPLDVEEQEHYVSCCRGVLEATPDEVAQILQAVRYYCGHPDSIQPLLIDALLAFLLPWHRQQGQTITDSMRDCIVLSYKELGAAHPVRWRFLQWLAQGAGADLRALVHMLVEDPPDDPQSAALVLAPLFQRRDYDPRILFPALFEALQHLSVAAPILDLSNYLLRASLVDVHPAADRATQLAGLLGDLAQQLTRLEEQGSGQEEESAESLGRRVDEGVALVVALCDALALIGDDQVIGKLYQALELGHRRIRTGVAVALAKLGEQRGIEELVQLATEPVARLRVLATAEELGFLDKIDARFTSDEARAEAQVALELAQPAYFGLAPAELELLDVRTQFWPGCEDPVRCYLFRFSYRLADAEYRNVAIAGPLVHAFQADLNDLSPDDLYAAFAGWDAEHESIYETPLDAPSVSLQTEIERFSRRLHDEGFTSVRGGMLGHFFGDRVFVATALQDGIPGTVVVDNQIVQWYRNDRRRQPIGPREAFCIYKGQRLLRSFNA